ncbi:TonB-dependent receptor [Flagellimonas onchidii]|uniref:TonB-dependent receptor n=1 Tax=Flagellimonas onchidii TaxID=2562684 RepID=UPI0010A6965F|nr:TonB-dependent receptor [Allomuricauda onchidii]
MKIFFCFVFFGLSYSGAIAQTSDFQYTNVPLDKILLGIETSYDVKFSYNPTLVDGVSVTLSRSNTSLESLINELQKQTEIIFEKIDDRYYILKKNTLITVCGYVRDSNGNIPLQGASIVDVKDRSLGTISDEKGYFDFGEAHKADTLFITYLGYEPLILPVDKIKRQECGTYHMVLANFVLNEVVVQEYMVSGMVKSKDGGIVIDPLQMDLLSGQSEPDVLQSIQLLPGIESPTETASGLYVRGGVPDQNLILLDGIKMYNYGHFFGLISAFNPYITDNVKIYRSGTKPQYGDRVSGVIDIETDSKIPKKTQGGFGLNMINVDGFLKVPISKKLGFFLSARRSFTDFLQTPTYNNFSDRVFQNTGIDANNNNLGGDASGAEERFYFSDVNFKVILQVSESDKFTFSNFYTSNQLDYSLDFDQMDTPFSYDLNIENIGANARWNKKWNTNVSSTAQFYYSQYDLKYENSNPFVEERFVPQKTNNIKEVGCSLHTDWILKRGLTLSGGYQFFNNQVQYELSNSMFDESSNNNNPTYALYAQLNFEKERKWYFDIGFRSNFYGAVNEFVLEPRAYIEKVISDSFRVKGTLELKNQAVSHIIEFATADFGLENQVWALANEFMVPVLQSQQFSGGFLVNKKGWNIDVDAYYKDIVGLTSLVSGFENTNEIFTFGESTSLGLDVLIKKKWRNYSSWLGYTHARTDFEFDGLNNGKPFRGNNDIAHSLTWSHFYKWKNLQFSLGWKYRTGIPNTSAKAVQNQDGIYEIVFNDVNALTLPDYHRLDFSMAYDFALSKKDASTKGKIGFSLLNLYNKKNILNRNYLHTFALDEIGTNGEITPVDQLSLGFTPNIVLRFSF